MFRMWGKIVKDTRLVRDTVICDKLNTMLIISLRPEAAQGIYYLSPKT